MLALPCGRRRGSVELGWRRCRGRVRHWVRGGGGPSCRTVCGSRGGRARPQHVRHRVVAVGWGHRCARVGDRRRSGARLLRAAEMRLKSSGSDGGGRSAGGRAGGCRIAGSTGAPLRRRVKGGAAPVLRRAPLAGAREACCPPTRWRPHGLRVGGGCPGGRRRVVPPSPRWLG